MLRRSNLIVLRLGRNAELPEFRIDILHKGSDARPQGPEIVVVQFLPFRRHRSEKRAAREDQVFPLQIFSAVDDEIFLFGADRGRDMSSTAHRH